MNNKYKLTIIGKDKKTDEFLVSITGEWKAKSLKEAIGLVKEEIRRGTYDYDFYGNPDCCNITIKPTDDVYFVGVEDNGLCKKGETPNDKLYIYSNKTDIDEV